MPLAAPNPIETGRLRVRLAAESDLPALLEVNGSEEVTALLPYTRWTSMADGEAWFQRMKNIQDTGLALQFVVANKSTDIAIGTCLLFRFEEGSARAELGYVLGRAHWGRGYMQEALEALIGCVFESMGLRRLEAEVDTRNRASARLLQRLGFTKEGLLRQRWVAKGEAKDVETWGLLRNEWPQSLDQPSNDIMQTADARWEARVAELWKRADSLAPDALVRAVDALSDELEPDDPRALFERACARDTAGIESEVEKYYRAALATDRLDAYRRSRACIQLASTLRILGHLEESEQLLVAELDRHLEAGHERALHDEARATLALTYAAQGRAAEAAGLALCALAPHLTRYNRSVAGNAAELVGKTWD